ncbi:MAG: AraC family transcriptional regulator [Myxococcales bacterium]|nr:AraC family transcriptional regulator [Myxococcales bacterium]
MGQNTSNACVLDLKDAFLPAIHALHLIELTERWDVCREELLRGLEIPSGLLSEPRARLSVRAFERLVERALRLTGEPGLGVYNGLQMRVSAHGYLGFAAMTSATVRDALELAVRYAPTRTNALGLRLVVVGDEASLFVDERASLGTAREALLQSLMIGIAQIGRAITGRIIVGAAELTLPRPHYMSRFEHALPGEMRFGRPRNRLVFDAAALDWTLTMADPAALRLAQAQCERELDALGYEGRFVARVAALLDAPDAGFRSLDEVARELHVSRRTLKRRLASKGTSFFALLEARKRERATLLLQAGRLSIDAVAGRLGYANTANFSRAFRRWTGQTPGAVRRARAER